MASYNRVIIMGNLTKDPVVRKFGKDNVSVAFMCVAINEKRKTRTGEYVSTPVFVNVNAYDRLADVCGRFCHKSQNIMVEGRLQMESREAPDGHPFTKLFVRAQSVKFLSPKSEGDKGRGSRGDNDETTGAEEDNGVEFVEDDAASEDGATSRW